MRQFELTVPFLGCRPYSEETFSYGPDEKFRTTEAVAAFLPFSREPGVRRVARTFGRILTLIIDDPCRSAEASFQTQSQLPVCHLPDNIDEAIMHPPSVWRNTGPL